MQQKRLFQSKETGKLEVVGQAISAEEEKCPIITVPCGNRKIGQIWNFSLPWKKSCPGRTQFCEEFCYVRNRNLRPSVLKLYEDNYTLSFQPDFAEQMINILKTSQLQWKSGQSRVFRFHPSGDFYSIEYIEKWIQIAKKLKDWKFYGYTHSWNCDLEPTLRQLQALPNVCLYASVDPLTEEPPKDWKLKAWMSYDTPTSGIRCKQDNALKIKAFEIWKVENNKPPKWKADPGKAVLREVAIRHEISPLFCLDCGYCIEGKGSVWFKMRTNPQNLLTMLQQNC
jgi:hypothetical protein